MAGGFVSTECTPWTSPGPTSKRKEHQNIAQAEALVCCLLLSPVFLLRRLLQFQQDAIAGNEFRCCPPTPVESLQPAERPSVTAPGCDVSPQFSEWTSLPSRSSATHQMARITPRTQRPGRGDSLNGKSSRPVLLPVLGRDSGCSEPVAWSLMLASPCL